MPTRHSVTVGSARFSLLTPHLLRLQHAPFDDRRSMRVYTRPPAIPFAEAFDAAEPELSGVRYAVFGLGDSFYAETYSQGSEHLDRRFAARGAERVGDYGRHDVSSYVVPSDAALEWLEGVLTAAGIAE